MPRSHVKSQPTPRACPLRGQILLQGPEVFVGVRTEPGCVGRVYPQVWAWLQCSQGWEWTQRGGGARPGPVSSLVFLLHPRPLTHAGAGWVPGGLWVPSSHPCPALLRTVQQFSPTCKAQLGVGGWGRAGARARGLSLPREAGEEMAGGMAPSAGRHSGLDGLARPAGLSHMRLELETRAPGLEHELAHSGGPGGGGGAQPRLLALWTPAEHKP